MNSSNIAIFAVVFIAGLALGGWVIYLLGHKKSGKSAPPAPPEPGIDLSFRSSYIILPAALAILTITAIGILYPSLPPVVDYRFSAAGVPRDSIGREAFLGIMAGAQILMVAAAAAVAGLSLRVARRMMADSPSPVNPTPVIWLMANMIVLPQLIVAFVALDAAYYARMSTHIMTPWLFSLVAIGAGTLVIIILFMRSFNDTRRAK